MKLATPQEAQIRQFHAYLLEHAQGRANAITHQALGDALGLGRNADRRLRALRHEANEMGLLVCADNTGYFVPETPQEVEEMVGRLRSQAAEMYESASLIERISVKHFYSKQMALTL